MFGEQKEVATDVLQRKYDIGESCTYGTVKVDVMANADIRVRFYDYKTTNLQLEETFSFVDKYKLTSFLEDHMSYYFADTIMKDFYA